MYEIRIEEGGRELLRQELADGKHYLGRSVDNDIAIKNHSVSRRHLQVNIAPDSVQVTDLGSTNGTNLNGRKLAPHQAATWREEDDISIGSLLISIWQRDQQESIQPQPEPLTSQGSFTGSGLTPFISSGSTIPTTLMIEAVPILIGSDASCNLRVTSGNVAPHNCMIQSKGNRVVVTELDDNYPVLLGGQQVEIGQETEWRESQTLQVGSALINLSYQNAVSKTDEEFNLQWVSCSDLQRQSRIHK